MSDENQRDGLAAGRGITLMIAGVFVMSVMDMMIKWMSADYPSIEIVFFRTLFGLIPLFAIVYWTGGIRQLRSRRWKLQLARGVAGTGATVGFFFALGKLELAEVVALAFASPLFVTALSVPLLGEKVGIRRVSAVLVGFVGVLIIVRPGADVFSPYALLPIGASFCFAMAMVLGRRLSSTDSSVSIVFYTTLSALAVSAIGTPSVWVMPVQADWGLLAALGLLGGCGQFLVTSAFRAAPAAIVAPFEYSALIWATLFGYLFWSEVPDAMTLLGGAIVIAAGLYIGYRETRIGRRPQGPGVVPDPPADVKAPRKP